MIAEQLLERALSSVVRTGSLEIGMPSGRRVHLGDGTGDKVVIWLTDTGAIWSLLLDPDMRTGELFMGGRLRVDQGTIYDFLMLVLRHGDDAPPSLPVRVLDSVRHVFLRWRQRNDARRSQQNVAHHYDLGDDLYELFLDPDWQYSCAYFEHPGQSLADAQLAKKRHIAAKLALGPSDRVLEIGSGWGGMALYLAEVAEVAHVTGVTLSEEQLRRANARSAQRKLDQRVSFRLQDYRAVQEKFDRIVSVGMFEHVGLQFYRAFFKSCAERLNDDGVMLLHTIGSSEAPSLINPWITRYIFPGGHLPSLSDMVPVIERAGLTITDVEVLRLHYAETLRHWRANFLRRRIQALALFDERFCRMWEYYLAMSEAAFRCEHIVVFQLQLVKRQEALPLTRDYIGEAEQKLRQREQALAK